MKKRIISLILATMLIVNALPLSIFAQPLNQGEFSGAGENTVQAKYFEDVPQNEWYYNAVMYAVEKGFFSGLDEKNFGPESSMTRGMFVTVLAQMAKADVSQYITTPFKDVSQDSWYMPYVAWASDKGISKGMGEGLFSPESNVNREQMAMLLVTFFDAYGIPYAKNREISIPKDMEMVSFWAKDGVTSLLEGSIINGDEKGYFRPLNDTKRAEAAALCQNIDPIVTPYITIANQALIKVPEKIIEPILDPIVPEKKPVEEDNNNSNNNNNNNNNNNDNPSTAKYTVSFQSNGGSAIGALNVKEGDKLPPLPTPYRAGDILTNWYTDLGCTIPVDEDSIVLGNLVLYAGYERASVEETKTTPFLTKLNESPNFSFQINSNDASMTQEEVKSKIEYSCISDPEFEGINVQGSEGVYFVSARGGFIEGSTNKLTLKSKDLYFQEDASSEVMDFTIFKKEVMTLKLNDGMVYIPAEKVTDMIKDGVSVDSLTVSLMEVKLGDDTEKEEDKKTSVSGSFVYQGLDLYVGDTAAIYEGTNPNERTDLDEDYSDEPVAYVTITAADEKTGTYSYKNADTEDVLFNPDILPISDNADTDNNPNNNSITVEGEDVFYGDSEFAEMGLDANTTVDVGDILAFYSGKSLEHTKKVEYGRVISVDILKTIYTIKYEPLTEEEVMENLEIYDNKPIEGDDLLADVDRTALEADIKQQAIDSGFVDEAAQYLTTMALETDSFSNIDDLIVVSQKDVAKLRSAVARTGNKVQIRKIETIPRVGTKLEHFPGYSGVRAQIEIKFEAGIDIGGGNELVVLLSGKFEEEVRISLNVKGGAVWKWKWIFPYIADYRMSANIEVFNFTGIEVDANVITAKKGAAIDWSTAESIADELRAVMEKGDESTGGTISDSLAAKYKKMLEKESEWIDIINLKIFSFEKSVDPFGILVVGVDISFVVAVNLNVSIGCDFFYENAKCYVFSMGLFTKTSSNDVITIVEEKYEFLFYAMGTMGVRAGVAIWVRVGLFSLNIGSLGLEGEVGAYIRMWGYFYYHLNYTESLGKTSKIGGALWLELGIYLEIRFKAEAINGKYEYAPTLYENEWPLWEAGLRENVQDFTYEPKTIVPASLFGQEELTKNIPSSMFSMRYLDLKTGEVLTKEFDEKFFEIKIDNPGFTYDAASNNLIVIPGDDVVLKGKMEITWKDAPLAFTSQKVTRTMPIEWIDPTGGFTIRFVTGKGSMIETQYEATGKPVLKVEDPTRVGYIFGGWYSDEAMTMHTSVPTTIPNQNTMLYAKWIPRTDIRYVIEHYQQSISNERRYIEAEIDKQILQGTADSTITPPVNTYEGFTAPVAETVEVSPDGSLVVRYYYTRNSHDMTFKRNDGSQDYDFSYDIKYGAATSAPAYTYLGYDFVSWSEKMPDQMPDYPLAYAAIWKEATDTPFKVEHYFKSSKEGVGGGYILGEMEYQQGTTNSEISVSEYQISRDGLTYQHATVNGEEKPTAKITADGQLVVKLFYDRVLFPVTYKWIDKEAGINQDVMVAEYPFEGIIREPSIPKVPDYAFEGWYKDEELSDKVVFDRNLRITASEATIYGKFIEDENADSFSIVYHGENGATNPNPKSYKTEDNDIKLLPLSDIEGYEFEGWYEEEAHKTPVDTILSGTKGKQYFYAKWETKEYTIDYELNNDNAQLATGSAITFTIESDDINIPDPEDLAEKDKKLKFKGWYEDEAFETRIANPAIKKGSTGDKTFWANWGETTNTITLEFENGESSQTIEFTPGESEINLPTPTKKVKDKYFSGWYTTPTMQGNEEGKIKISKSEQSEHDLTLYAGWSDPIQIYTKTDFEAYMYNGWHTIWADFILMEDIDFGGAPIKMIAGSEDFHGTFDGNNKSITNFTLPEASSGYASISIFGIVYDEAVVKDLTLYPNDISISLKGEQFNFEVAILAGMNFGTIKNCNIDFKNAKKLKIEATTFKIALIAGYNYGIIDGCVVNLKGLDTIILRAYDGKNVPQEVGIITTNGSDRVKNCVVELGIGWSDIIMVRKGEVKKAEDILVDYKHNLLVNCTVKQTN